MMAAMTQPARRRVALVSGDLMFQSQLAGALSRNGGELVAVNGRDLPESEFDTAFVDLNADVPYRLGLIARLRETRPALEIVAFCHHGEDQTRRQAMALGANTCVTNGALQAVALRLGGVQVRSGERT